jgi:hypothetical protein
MRKLALLTITVSAVLGGAQRSASAQLLDSSRCTNAFGVSQETAQRRYAWALYCSAHPQQGGGTSLLPGWHYMTPESIDYYNNDLDASEKVHLFPTYFNYDSQAAGPWDIPAGLLTTGADWTAAPTSTTVCLSVPHGGLFPASALHAGLCVAGCYVDGTELQFADGTMGIKAAAESGKVDLVTLSPSATLDNLKFTTNKVEHYITDMREDTQVIYTLSMASGGQLKVTSEHPLLTSDGVIHQAQGLHRGDELLLASGKPDPIVNISVAKIFGKVWNVKPVTTDYVSNIVVAGGYLNGSVRYQNEFLGEINALILRRSLGDQADKIVAN